MEKSKEKMQSGRSASDTAPADDACGLVVRRATSADCDLVFELIQELARFERLADEVVGSREELQESVFGPCPQAEVLLAQYRQETAGFCLFYGTYSTFLTRPGVYIEDLYVRPPFRGQGVGTHLLAKVAEVVVDRGWGRMEWSVLDWNRSAIDFYRNLSAREVEEWLRFRMVGDSVARLARRASGTVRLRPPSSRGGATSEREQGEVRS